MFRYVCLNEKSISERSPVFFLQGLHISDLPEEVIRYILHLIVAPTLDLRFLEMFGTVRRGRESREGERYMRGRGMREQTCYVALLIFISPCSFQVCRGFYKICRTSELWRMACQRYAPTTNEQTILVLVFFLRTYV